MAHWFLSQWFWLGLTLAIGVGEWTLYVLVPAQARRLAKHGAYDRAICLLERVAALPAMAGEGVKIGVQYQLGVLYFQHRRFAEAAEQFRALLQERIPAGLESDTRRRLADSLENIGQIAEANAERNKAQDVVQEKGDVLSLLSRADLLKRENRYDEAFGVYEKALAQMRRQAPHARAEVMVKMCLTAFEGGHPDLTIQWAEAAIAGQAREPFLSLAHSMAGVGYGNQSQFSQAEPHLWSVYELARATGDATRTGRSLAVIASHQMRQGRLQEALQTCDRIFRDGLASRTAHVVHSECLQILGRFEEARFALYQARDIEEAGEAKIPFHQRRHQALMSFGLARVLAHEGQAQTAWNQLQEAAAGFAQDKKLTLWCEAVGAWILALLDRPEQARQKMQYVQEHRGEFAEDGSDQRSCAAALAMTAFSLGDYPTSKALWLDYLALGPDPAWLPRGYYHLGECCGSLGDKDGARQAFTQALLPGIDTYDAQRARRRLAEYDS